MAFLYVIMIGVGFVFAFLPELLGGSSAGRSDEIVMKIYGFAIAGISLPLAIVYGAAPFFPRKPWAWAAHMALIALGMTSACCIPACLPLLLFWLKPETKTMFGKT
jgi:hypothetical protein